MAAAKTLALPRWIRGGKSLRQRWKIIKLPWEITCAFLFEATKACRRACSTWIPRRGEGPRCKWLFRRSKEHERNLFANNFRCRAPEIQISDSTLWAKHFIVSCCDLADCCTVHFDDFPSQTTKKTNLIIEWLAQVLAYLWLHESHWDISVRDRGFNKNICGDAQTCKWRLLLRHLEVAVVFHYSSKVARSSLTESCGRLWQEDIEQKR